jgi:hypothetical protein
MNSLQLHQIFQLTRRLGFERELKLPRVIVDAITGFHFVTIDVCKPPYTTLRVVLEISAMRIEEVVITLMHPFGRSIDET